MFLVDRGRVYVSFLVAEGVIVRVDIRVFLWGG